MGEAEQQVVKLLISFIISLVIVFITAKIIGEERKIQWFKKRKQSRFFSRRGFGGECCHFGYPCKWQGLVVTFLMTGSISIIVCFILF